MQGIISLLDTKATEMVEEVWHVVASHLDTDPSIDSLVPHLSWHVAEAYPYQALHQKVEETARNSRPIQIHTTGFGIFRIPAPVLYLSVTVTEDLLAFHRSIYAIAEPLSFQPNPYYAPKVWVPHITLLYQQPDLGRYSEVFRLLEPFPIERDITIDNFAIFCPGSGGKTDICTTFFANTEVNDVA